MTIINITTNYTSYTNADELTKADQKLIHTCRAATANAYAPYSNFKVAATALLHNGTVVTGTNQENASYPVGICAERTLLATLHNMYADSYIIALAISYHNTNPNAVSNIPASPCGMCRQALLEYVQVKQQELYLLLTGQQGSIFKINKVADLLPLSFSTVNLTNT